MSDSTPNPNPTPTLPPAPAANLPKSGRGLRIALVVSLGLNLAIAGLVAGTVLRSHSQSGRNDAVRELGFGPFTEALGPQDRRALRQAFLAKTPDARHLKRQRRDDAVAVLDALRATPFVPQTLSDLMTAQQQRTARQLILGQEVLRDFLIAMTPADRAAFADRLAERLHPGKDGDGGREKGTTPHP